MTWRPSLVDEGRHAHHAPSAVDAGQRAEPKDEAVPIGLRQVVDLVHAEIHAAGGDLVQQRLPQMRATAVDQRDVSLAASAELVAQPGDKLEPACPAADDDNAMRTLGHGLPVRPVAATRRKLERVAHDRPRPTHSCSRIEARAVSDGQGPRMRWVRTLCV